MPPFKFSLPEILNGLRKNAWRKNTIIPVYLTFSACIHRRQKNAPRWKTFADKNLIQSQDGELMRRAGNGRGSGRIVDGRQTFRHRLDRLGQGAGVGRTVRIGDRLSLRSKRISTIRNVQQRARTQLCLLLLSQMLRPSVFRVQQLKCHRSIFIKVHATKFKHQAIIGTPSRGLRIRIAIESKKGELNEQAEIVVPMNNTPHRIDPATLP